MEIKDVYSITELEKLGYPRKLLNRAVNGCYSPFFARRTSPKGKWMINYKKFKDYWDRGIFEKVVD